MEDSGYLDPGPGEGGSKLLSFFCMGGPSVTARFTGLDLALYSSVGNLSSVSTFLLCLFTTNSIVHDFASS